MWNGRSLLAVIAKILGITSDGIPPPELSDERGCADMFEHGVRGPKLDPRLTPKLLAAELERRAQKVRSALWSL